MSTADAGGKGAALAKLAATFPVPAFFVIAAEAFDESGLLPDARESVNAGITQLGRGGRFAVRSSGREEDGADSAHAGQFETELNVRRTMWRRRLTGVAVGVQRDAGGVSQGEGSFGRAAAACGCCSGDG